MSSLNKQIKGNWPEFIGAVEDLANWVHNLPAHLQRLKEKLEKGESLSLQETISLIEWSDDLAKSCRMFSEFNERMGSILRSHREEIAPPPDPDLFRRYP